MDKSIHLYHTHPWWVLPVSSCMFVHRLAVKKLRLCWHVTRGEADVMAQPQSMGTAPVSADTAFPVLLANLIVNKKTSGKIWDVLSVGRIMLKEPPPIKFSACQLLNAKKCYRPRAALRVVKSCWRKWNFSRDTRNGNELPVHIKKDALIKKVTSLINYIHVKKRQGMCSWYGHCQMQRRNLWTVAMHALLYYLFTGGQEKRSENQIVIERWAMITLFNGT